MVGRDALPGASRARSAGAGARGTRGGVAGGVDRAGDGAAAFAGGAAVRRNGIAKAKWTHISKAFIGRYNLTLQKHLRRSNRKTNGFSKTSRNRGFAVALRRFYNIFFSVPSKPRELSALATVVEYQILEDSYSMRSLSLKGRRPHPREEAPIKDRYFKFLKPLRRHQLLLTSKARMTLAGNQHHSKVEENRSTERING